MTAPELLAMAAELERAAGYLRAIAVGDCLGKVDPEARAPARVLIARALADGPLRPPEIARRTGLSVETVRHTLKINPREFANEGGRGGWTLRPTAKPSSRT